MIFRVGGHHGRLRLRDFGLAGIHLRLRLFHPAVGCGQISARLRQTGLVVPRVNFQDYLAGLDRLVVLDQQFGDAARHL